MRRLITMKLLGGSKAGVHYMTISVEQAQSTLKELIEKTACGEKVVITRDEKPVAELVAVPANGVRPVFGSCKGMLTIVADDEEHLNDFKEYIE